MALYIQAAASTVEDLLDKLSISLTSGELEIVEKLYFQALKLELEFISAQPIIQPSIVPVSQVQVPAKSNLKVFCDFDMTCSAFDSSALLAEMAIMTARKAYLNECETQPSQVITSDLSAAWGSLSSKYIEEYEQCIDSIIPTESGMPFGFTCNLICHELYDIFLSETKFSVIQLQLGILIMRASVKHFKTYLLLRKGQMQWWLILVY